MLLPALSKARDKARIISCVSNLKQVGIYYQSYCDNNDDFFLLAHNYNTKPPLNLWNSYVVSSGEFPSDFCIATSRAWPKGNNGKGQAGSALMCPCLKTFSVEGCDGGIANFNYGLNYRTYGWISGTHYRKTLTIKNPSSRMNFSEPNPKHSTGYCIGASNGILNLTDWSATQNGYRHDNGRAVNCLFVDGHAETIKSHFLTVDTSYTLTQQRDHDFWGTFED